MQEKIITKKDLIEAKRAPDEDVLLVHTKEYIAKLKEGTLSYIEILKLELPYSKELVEASFSCAGGTILTCQRALVDKVSVHLGGGFHHAFPDHGEGFCVFNDMAIGIKKCQKDGLIKKALVIDCDLHQGNGTAFIFHNDETVYTLSIHQEKLYPYPKQESSLDIGLENGAGDEEYLKHLEEHVPQILKKFSPDLIVYVAGADPYQGDQLGNLQLTLAGLRKRDEFILSQAKTSDVPVAVVLAGGYAYEVEDTIAIHCQTIQTAKEIFERA